MIAIAFNARVAAHSNGLIKLAEGEEDFYSINSDLLKV